MMKMSTMSYLRFLVTWLVALLMTVSSSSSLSSSFLMDVGGLQHLQQRQEDAVSSSSYKNVKFDDYTASKKYTASFTADHADEQNVDIDSGGTFLSASSGSHLRRIKEQQGQDDNLRLQPPNWYDFIEDHLYGKQLLIYELEDCLANGNGCSENEFCGKDGTCHPKDCPTIYKYGWSTFTGNYNDDDDALQCVEYTDEEGEDDEWDRIFYHNREDLVCLTYRPLSVSYNCKKYGTGCVNDLNSKRESTPHVYVNRKCTARSKAFKDRLFVCYDMDIPLSSSLESYYSSYVEQTIQLHSKGATCDDIGGVQENFYDYIDTPHRTVPIHDYGGLITLGFDLPAETGVGDDGTEYSVPSSTIGAYDNDRLPKVPNGTTSVFDEEGDINETVFNMKKAASTVYIKSILLDPDYDEVTNDLPACEVGCTAYEFCGIDGKCHARNCETFYQYGPQEWTGNKETTSENGDEYTTSLMCEAINEMMMNHDEDMLDTLLPCSKEDGYFPILSRYLCQGQSYYSQDECGNPDPYNNTQGRILTMNRRCFGRPNKEQNFTCYDIAPTTDMTDYSRDYLQKVENNPGCDGSTAEKPVTVDANGTEVVLPLYAYHKMEGCLIHWGDFSRSTCPMWLSGPTFDPIFAKSIIRVELSGGLIIPPTQGIPTPSSSASHFVVGNIMGLQASQSYVSLVTSALMIWIVSL